MLQLDLGYLATHLSIFVSVSLFVSLILIFLIATLVLSYTVHCINNPVHTHTNLTLNGSNSKLTYNNKHVIKEAHNMDAKPKSHVCIRGRGITTTNNNNNNKHSYCRVSIRQDWDKTKVRLMQDQGKTETRLRQDWDKTKVRLRLGCD